MRTHAKTLVTGLLALAAIAALCAPPAAHAAAKRTFVFVHDRGDNGTANQVFVFQVERSTRLRPVRGSPFVSANSDNVCSGPCSTVAYSTGRKMLFTAGGGGVSAWTVSSKGALAEVVGSPFGAVNALGVGVVDRAEGTFVYTTVAGTSDVHGFRVETDGTLSAIPGSPWTAGPQSIGVATFGDVVCVANQGIPFGVHSFRAQTDGSLVAAPGSPVAFGSRYYSVKTGRRFPGAYVADCAVTARQIDAIAIDPATGTLTAAPGSPASTAGVNSCSTLAVGEKLAVVFAYPGKAIAFRVEPSAALTPLGGEQATTGIFDFVDAAFLPGDRGVVVSDYVTKVALFRTPASGKLRRLSARTIAATDVSGVVVGQR